jgi:hypothetical protein
MIRDYPPALVQRRCKYSGETARTPIRARQEWQSKRTAERRTQPHDGPGRGLLDSEAEAITRKPIETNCATRSALWFRSVPTALTTLVVKLYRSGYGDYCWKQACGQRDPLPTLLTDIVEEPMPALDERAGLSLRTLGFATPAERFNKSGYRGPR